MIDLDRLDVVHNVAENQFEIALGEETAVVRYTIHQGKMSFLHTGVPVAYRNQGIAAKLVQTSLDYARDQKLQVVPLCSYVAEFVQAFPDYQQLL